MHMNRKTLVFSVMSNPVLNSQNLTLLPPFSKGNPLGLRELIPSYSMQLTFPGELNHEYSSMIVGIDK